MLVLDLDETLVHSSQYRLHQYNYQLNVPMPGLMQSYTTSISGASLRGLQHAWCTFYVSERPYLENFIKQVSKQHQQQ